MIKELGTVSTFLNLISESNCVKSNLTLKPLLKYCLTDRPT